MLVKELKNILEDFNDDDEVVFEPENSRYVESIEGYPAKETINAFYGEDYEAVVIYSGGQCGAK